MHRIFYSFIILTFLFGCKKPEYKPSNDVFFYRWTDRQKDAFKTLCSQTETFNKLCICFIGFNSDEFDSVLVNEYKDHELINSFKVYVFPSQSPDEKTHKERWGTIWQNMNINYRYVFIVPKQKPWELKNMKMIMRAHFTMNSEGYGCDMFDYTIDGIRFKNGNPIFHKH